MEFVTIAYLLLSFICLILILKGLKSGLGKSEFILKKQSQIFIGTIAVLLLWLLVISLLANSGRLSDFSTLPPKITLVLVPPMIIWLIITWKSKTLKLILNHIPLQSIIYLQSFRIFVELILWKQLLIGVTPIQMTLKAKILTFLLD